MNPFLPNAAFRHPRGWLMAMDWDDLLFLHWPVAPESMQRFIPKGLDLDIRDGKAWISVVPFRMSHVRPRFLPCLHGLHAFAELNVRTYVVRGGIPGVWFFSLDAANQVAVRAARRFFHLPYFDADMQVSRESDRFRYDSRRTHAGAPPAAFAAEYGPVGPVYRAADGSLEDWLTARYCFYAADDEGGIYRTTIHHKPWRLQPATAKVSLNTMTEQIGLPLEGEPLLQFALKTEVVAWLPERLP